MQTMVRMGELAVSDEAGQTLVSLATGFNEVLAAGLTVASGMLLATTFYWDRTDATRGFALRFMQRHRGVAPNSHQAAGSRTGSGGRIPRSAKKTGRSGKVASISPGSSPI